MLSTRDNQDRRREEEDDEVGDRGESDEEEQLGGGEIADRRKQSTPVKNNLPLVHPKQVAKKLKTIFLTIGILYHVYMDRVPYFRLQRLVEGI